MAGYHTVEGGVWMKYQGSTSPVFIQYAGTHHKVGLFADDSFLTQTKSLTTLPKLQNLLSHFSALFGLRINPHKTTALHVTLTPSTVSQLQASFLYHWNTLFLDYLGIKLTPAYSSLFATNYYPLLRSLTSLMQSWCFPSLYWIGHIHAVKRTVLTKILYWFPTLPDHIPSFFSRLLQSQILSYIWAYQRPRISRSILYRQSMRWPRGPNLTKY